MNKDELLRQILDVKWALDSYREKVKKYYFDVLFTRYRCPSCKGKFHYMGLSLAKCSCGLVINPTIEFQRSSCCNAMLFKKICHYACSKCGRSVPSKFLFDERLFDAEYFREMMSQYRGKKRRDSRNYRYLCRELSGSFFLEEDFDLGQLEDLDMDLKDLIGSEQIEVDFDFACEESEYNMDLYWAHVTKELAGYDELLFDSFGELDKDSRKDRIWRFVTLVFMEQERLVMLLQDGDDILVEKL
jgi:hypothetical protein